MTLPHHVWVSPSKRRQHRVARSTRAAAVNVRSSPLGDVAFRFGIAIVLVLVFVGGRGYTGFADTLVRALTVSRNAAGLARASGVGLAAAKVCFLLRRHAGYAQRVATLLAHRIRGRVAILIRAFAGGGGCGCITVLFTPTLA